ncbi:MAG: alginate lyase family protein, partial [Sediminibacterium sp.]|nr:alginate lyase family protein [Sediminibacterium sp.]
MKKYFSIVLLCLAHQILFAQTPKVYSYSGKVLLYNKTSANATALKALVEQANNALEFRPVSVMEKDGMPPSGDKHDYMSLAPYFWPNP